ncbi:MAG: hypothetical protein JHD09_07865 [Gemmataceae bacterium]|jgi:hypothetical protein|nr:hypothetical protein [Gemmataceae bacterium]MBJ7345183.1 hypothetical protein [Gemmataceae bacterium]MBY0326123.1 DUF11 domain-containing protein [Gemmataceae bacterium]
MLNTNTFAILMLFAGALFSLAQVPGNLPIETDKETPTLKTDEGSQVSVITRFVDNPEAGKPCTMEITLKNLGALPLEELVLSQEWKTKPEILEVNPKPFIQEIKWTWEIPELQPGTGKVFQFKVLAADKDNLTFKPAVAYKVATLKKNPEKKDGLLVQVQGPQWVRRGQRAVFDIVVANLGLTPAENVTIRDKLPQGLRHPEGELIEATLGDIPAGQTKSIRLETLAVENGKFSQNIQVASTNGEKKLYQSDISVSDGQINLQWKKSWEDTAKGELEMILEAKIESIKTGQIQFAIQTVVPEGLEIVGSNPQARYESTDSTNKLLVWNNPQVTAGKWSAKLRLKAIKPGDWQLNAKASMENSADTSSMFLVRIEGTSEIQGLFQNTSLKANLGSESEIRFSLKNSGSIDLKNTSVRFLFPDGIVPLAWNGPTIAGLDGQNLNFDDLPVLGSRADKTYSVNLKGLSPGEFRIVVEYGMGNIKRSSSCSILISPLP